MSEALKVTNRASELEALIHDDGGDNGHQHGQDDRQTD